MSVRMNQTALIKEISKRTETADAEGFAPKDIKLLLSAISSIAEDELGAGFDFKLPGVATVRLAYQPKKPRREARNPSTGETFMADPVPAKIAVRARPDAKLKRSAPSPGSKGGKAIADAYKAKRGL